MAGLFVKH